jgi:predicted RNA-binding protein YlxR (DUF448 family)
VGCGHAAPKERLVRFVLRDGELRRDPDGRQPGRGAYVHPDADCIREATRRRGFDRSFRTPVRAPADLATDVLESVG